MLCPYEESTLLSSGFLASFLANAKEGLRWPPEEEAFGYTLKFLKKEGVKIVTLSSVSYFITFSYAFFHRPCFVQQNGWIIPLWTMIYL